MSAAETAKGNNFSLTSPNTLDVTEIGLGAICVGFRQSPQAPPPGITDNVWFDFDEAWIKEETEIRYDNEMAARNYHTYCSKQMWEAELRGTIVQNLNMNRLLSIVSTKVPRAEESKAEVYKDNFPRADESKTDVDKAKLEAKVEALEKRLLYLEQQMYNVMHPARTRQSKQQQQHRDDIVIAERAV